MKKQILALSLLFFIVLSSLNAQEKQVIKKAEDLPKHSYSLESKNAMEIIQDKEKILGLAEMIKSDIEADLEKYDIQDNSALKGMYGQLRVIAALNGDYKKALDYIQKERKLSDKESEKITRGIESETLFKAAIEKNTLEADKLNSVLSNNLESKLDITNFSIIQEDIEESKGLAEIYSKNLILGSVESQLQVALDNNKGDVPGDLVSGLINVYYTLNFYIPYKEAYYQAYLSVLEKHVKKVKKVDIWKDRNITINEAEGKAPVLIGIWDTGVDMDVFPEKKQWKNSKEKFDGKDTDGNGYIDDVYGIAFNLEGEKDPNYLEPTAHSKENIKEFQIFIKGFMDIIANIDSKEATDIKKYFSQLKPEEVKEFTENLSLYGNYSHGTHVAGIAEEDNEMARIIMARFTADYKNIPSPPTDEIIDNWSKSYGYVVDYFKDNKVRVVNMSWGNSYESVLSDLELNGIGKDDEARKALAKKYFTQQYDAFKAAIESAPEILFVCAAGNSNDDVDFTGDYPSSLNLPNLITVGAVDIEGKKTNFTTEGKSVDVYANGYEVESYVPGGDRIAFSGTSMASPMVVNLAGKILAVNPKLTPEEVIDIIIKSSTKSTEDENVLLINPKEALALVKK